MLGKAVDEIKRSDEIYKSESVAALRTQMESDFGLSGPYEFSWPQDQKGWDVVTTNLFKVTANKIVGLLSSWWLSLFIDIDDETRRKRETISKTEQFANGCIHLADRELTSVPSGQTVQSSLSWFAAIRGGAIVSVLFGERDGKPFPNLRVYDPLACQWIEGENETTWFCFRRYVSEEYMEKTYPKFDYGKATLSPLSSDKRALIYFILDSDEWKLACNGLWIPDSGEKHDLGYVPVFIRPVGAMPSVQSESYQNKEMKVAWQSIFANDRELAEVESRLLSVGSSIARESGKIKAFGEWDSNVAGSSLPEELAKAGFTSDSERNQFILLNKAKGEAFKGLVPPPTMEAIDRFRAIIRGMAIIGMIDPIAFGQMTRSGSGILAAELRSAALEFINPYKKCIEDMFVWIAEECVKQFKGKKFSKMELDGRDAHRNKFYDNFKPEDVEEKHFEATLVPDRIRDEIQELGAAIQKVEAGLSSKRTVMVKHNLVDDPDKEMDIMDEELAAQDPVFQYDKLAKYFKDQGDERMARYYMALSAITIEKTVQDAIAKALIPAEVLNPPGVIPQTQGQPRDAFVPPGRNEGDSQPSLEGNRI